MTSPGPLLSPRAAWVAPLSRWLGALTGVLAFVLLSLHNAQRVHPPLPPAITLEVTFPPGVAGQVEPILCTGMWRAGDLLVVEYLDEHTAVLRYDHWGHGGPGTPPFALESGTPRILHVALPGFTTFHNPPPGARAPLRLTLDGRDLLATDVPTYGRQVSQIFFGENPIGASCAAAFRGTLRRENGHVVRGGPESFSTLRERLVDWLRTLPWQVAAVALASAAFGGASTWLVAWRLARPRAPRPLHPKAVKVPPPPETPADRARRLVARCRSHRWFAGAAAICTLGYAWLVTLGSFNFNHAEVFGDFYDYQAASFLQGRLDVPEEAIGGEAFEANGKLYGYFGPTPALLRLPFVAAGIGFGKLSRAFMLLYFAASLVAAYLILREATRYRSAPAYDADVAAHRSGHHSLANRATLHDPAEPSPFAIVVLVFSVGWGSTVFFLGCRGLIFHEAILAGITFALWSCWCAMRHLRTPARRWWISALIAGVLSLHCRPPTGLFALTLLGCVVVVLAAQEFPRRLFRHAGVGVLCAIGLFTLNGLAFLKFGALDPAPLRISRPYKDPGRLAHIDGRSFHLVNLPYNFDTYVLRPNFRIEPRFPWIYLGTHAPQREFPRAKIDLPDHTLALPYAMPSLFFLATLGCLGAAIALPGTRLALGALWAAMLPMTLALFAAVATAQRYTGDFCPFLICAAALGLTATESAPPLWRRALRVSLVLLTLAAVAITAALTLHYQGDTLWGVPEDVRQNYQLLRRRIDASLGIPPAP